MGREVRRVPKDWEHPKKRGSYVPLHGGSVSELQKRWDEEAAQWKRGMRRGWTGEPAWVPHGQRKDYPFEDWDGDRPDAADYMPDWPEVERTHLQMYETCTEGTPISPVFKSPEKLARWLADNGASSFGHMTATYEQWLATIKRGSAVSAFIQGGVITSGVAFEAEAEAERKR